MASHSSEVDVASFEPGILQAPFALQAKFSGMENSKTTAAPDEGAHDPEPASYRRTARGRYTNSARQRYRTAEECFGAGIYSGEAQNRLSLFLRYGTTHERAFRHCLSDLLKLRKRKLQMERGFESQESARAAERRREVAAQCRWVGANKPGIGGAPVSAM